MRQLLLLRHAKSSWEDAKLADHDRPLNSRGRATAGRIRAAMRELGLSPDLVLVSTATRTRQTLEALEPWDDTPLIEPMDALYLATGPQLVAVLNGVAETVRSVMLVGHNPGMHDLAVSLAGSAHHARDARRMAEKFPTGALAEFAVPGPWHALAPGGARLIRFLSPDDMPHHAA